MNGPVDRGSRGAYSPVMPKVALAYSGSLDTTICVHYLRHVKGMKVYTFSANVGQPEYLEPLAEQAPERKIGIDGESVAVTKNQAGAIGITMPPKPDKCPVGHRQVQAAAGFG